MCNPRCAPLAARADEHLMFGVPLHWMNDWGTPFALHPGQAQGATLTDADGHAPAPVVQAIAAQAARGPTAMLASADAGAVGALLAERFGLPFWPVAMTATDANRDVIRWLRTLIAALRLPWCVTQLGARCESQVRTDPPRNGREAGAALDEELEQLIHLMLLNRGVPITPFHPMLLVSPATTRAQVQQLLAAFDEVVGSLAAAHG